MKEIKYRQKIKPQFVKCGENFHYWGFIDGGFISPMGRVHAANEGDQYTGLKDESGVEIYEGDIVSMHQFLFDGMEVEKMISGVIGWDEYGLTIKQIRNEFIEEYCGYEAGDGELSLNSFYGLHEESWRIIGNIHENPELISG